MPRSKKNKQRQKNASSARHPHVNSMARQADNAVRAQGMDVRHWEQNALEEITIRLTSASPGENYHLFITMDANGWCTRLYKRDIPANLFTDTGNLVNQGFKDYGEFSQQWSANAYLYELYRTKQFSFRFSPATLAGFGSQGASWQIDDPSGVIASEIRNGLNLTGDLFTGTSDARKIRTWSSIKTASHSININDLLFAEQQQANLETIDPEAAVPGDRQRYQTGDPSGGNPTRSYLPAIVFCMQVELNQIDVTDDRDVVLGVMRTLCKQQFMQRRVEYPSPTSGLRCKLSQEAMLNILSRMTGFSLQFAKSAERPKICAKQPTPVVHVQPQTRQQPDPKKFTKQELEAALAGMQGL